MSSICVNDAGQLVVACPYSARKAVKAAGGKWDAVLRRWTLAFTPGAVEVLIDNLPDPQVHPDVEAVLVETIEREKKLRKIRAMSRADHPVRLKVPGLLGSLYNYQKLGVMFALANGHGVLIADEMGLGKALAKGTEVYTPTGPVPIEELQVGDEVIGSAGKPVPVRGFYPQGRKEAYRVTFSDGSSVDCCKEHLWSVNTPTRKNRGNPPLVMTTLEILESGLTRRNGKNGTRWNWYIPMVAPVEFETRDEILELMPPYVFGLILGDGSLSAGRLGFSTGDDEIVELVESLMGDDWHLRKATGKYNYELSKVDFGGVAPQLEPVHRFFRERGLKGSTSPEKKVPLEYMVAPVEDRLELLRGLMDADGTVAVGERGNAAVFSTTSEGLRDAVVWLCRSLGGTASVGDKDPFYYDGDGNRVPGRHAWNITLSLPAGMCPFRLSRKAEIYPNRREKYPPVRAIVSIEPVGAAPMFCISVDADDSLYVTKDFVVTHNTLQAIATALFLKDRGEISEALIIVPPSLKYNWAIEIEKWTSEPYVVVDGTPDQRVAQWLRDDVFFYVVNFELLLEDLFGGKTYKPKEDETKQQQIEREAKMAKTQRRARILAPVRERLWGMIAVDEAQALKNSLSKRSNNVRSLRSKFRVALTGTPLDGRLEELHSVMEFVCPGLLGSRTTFLQRHALTDPFGKVVRYRRVGEVREKIAPHFIRRLKRDVLKDLPDKVYSNRMVEMTSAEKKVYKALAKNGHAATEDTAALVACIRCKQFCDSPQLLADALEEAGEVEAKEIRKLRKLKASKLEALRDVLREVVVENAHKVLVFSQYAEMVKLLMGVFDEMGLKYLCIWGDTPKKDRAAYQEMFNTDATVDAMVGTEAMSAGLNFTAADYVVNYDDNWAPAFMAQREDRAHRIGQKNTVTVVNFVCVDTIEERIRTVLYEKSKISAQALGDDLDEMVLKRLGPQDTAKLL